MGLYLYKKTEGMPLRLLDMLLGKIIKNPEPHFSRLRRPEQLDGSAVKCGAQPLLGIQADTRRSFFFCLFHIITSEKGYPLPDKKYAEGVIPLRMIVYSGFL